MKKRILSIVLAAALLVTLIPLGAPTAKAASEFTASPELVEIIKKWEGFSAKPYWDVSQWTVGYGTRVPEGKLDEYNSVGISVEEATALLHSMLNDMGKSVNSFIDKFGLTVTQGQFDAMLDLSFNCGTAWLFKTSTLRTAIIEGWTGSDLLFAFGQWSTAAGATKNSLIRRRLSECNMYLNGVYGSTPPENYCYVRFDPNGGSSEIKTQGYDSNTPVSIRAVPTYEGYNFVGWFTDPTGGEQVTTLDAGVKGFTLYAHWTAGEGADMPQDTTTETITGTAVNYQKQIATGVLNAFNNPVKGALVVNAYQLNEVVTVVEEYTDSTGTKWGKVSGSGWINLTYTCEPNSDSAEANGVKVTVTNNNVNLRRGPGTTYAKIGSVDKGAVLTITSTSVGGGYTWGKSSQGWIALKYTDYDSVVNNNTPTTPENNNNNGNTAVIATGTVSVSSGRLRVRSGPSTGYAIVTNLSNGARVEILEQKTVGNTVWGRISNGWISLDYVKLDTQESVTPPAEETTPPTQPTQPEPPAQEPAPPVQEPAPPAVSTAVTGKVKVTSGRLRVRADASTSSSIVAFLNNGASVTILEQKTVNGTTWGRVSNGWISMDYVTLDSQTAQPGQTAPTPESSTAVTGKVKVTSGRLRVRASASTSSTIVGFLSNGASVTILEQKTVNGTVWGRVSNGWISMDYVQLDGQSSAGSADSAQGTAGTVKVSSGRLRIRASASTTSTIVGFLSNGASVTILETKVVDGVTWGRIAKGWISMEYVQQ